jgi:hypothetical protein
MTFPMPFFHPSSPSGYCDDEASAFITIEADPYSNNFFYNTVVDEVWRAYYPSGGSNYVFQRYDGITGAYIADTAPVAKFWDEWNIVFVESTGKIYSSIGDNDETIILDATDGSFIGSAENDAYILSLDPYTDTLWSGDWTSFANILKLNEDGSRAATYQLDTGGTAKLGGITFSEDYVWVADYTSPRMYRIAKSDGVVTEYDTSGVLGTGEEVNQIAYDETRNCIWAFDSTSTIRKFDIATNAFVDSWVYPVTYMTHPASNAISFTKHISLYNSTLDKLILSSIYGNVFLLIDPDNPNNYTTLNEDITAYYMNYYEHGGCIYFWVSDNIKKYCCYG